MAIIHKRNQPNLDTNKRGNQKNLRIVVCIFAIYCNLLSIYFDFQKKKKKILGNLATLVHFHFTKILCMSCNGIYFFFVFGVTKQQKFTQKMQLKPNSMCCCYVANNSHQLDQISHACNFITPCVRWRSHFFQLMILMIGDLMLTR